MLRVSGINPRLPNIEPLLTRGFWVVWKAQTLDAAVIQADRDGRVTAELQQLCLTLTPHLLFKNNSVAYKRVAYTVMCADVI